MTSPSLIEVGKIKKNVESSLSQYSCNRHYLNKKERLKINMITETKNSIENLEDKVEITKCSFKRDRN